MSLVGTEFAYNHMEGMGWSRGTGLGKHSQGIVDAIKPKLKFDQTGVGHNRAEEFEFHWWDHVFNKAAKTIKVDENEEGDIQVLMNIDKSDLSTKKMRKKMMKKVRNQLYSNFVKAGTMTGGKMEASGNCEEIEIVKDLSKIKELSDDQLVAACGGLTAHKGARHGLNMTAKLDRIAEAEKEFMAKYGGGAVAQNVVDSVDEAIVKKDKKKKNPKYKELGESIEVEHASTKKKKKKSKDVEEEIYTDIKKKKKRHKKEKSEC